MIAIAYTAIAMGSPCVVPSSEAISIPPITKRRDGFE